MITDFFENVMKRNILLNLLIVLITDSESESLKRHGFENMDCRIIHYREQMLLDGGVVARILC